MKFIYLTKMKRLIESIVIAGVHLGTLGQVSALPVYLTSEVQREFFEKGWGSYLIK
jgi:hypothetical protein